MTTTEGLDALCTERLSGASLRKVQDHLVRLTACLERERCPLREVGHVSTREVHDILEGVFSSPVGYIYCVSLSDPLPYLPELSEKEYVSLATAYREGALLNSVGKTLGQHLSDTHWAELKQGLGETKDKLMYGILDHFGEQFRGGLRIWKPRSRFLPPGTLTVPDTLRDCLWGSFCTELFYYIGAHLVRNETIAAKLEPLVERLPWFIPLGTHADKASDWLVPCQ